MHKLMIFFLPFLLLTFGCSRKGEDPLVMQQRMRKMQTHTFVGKTAKEVTKEMIAVLQDDGYMIKNVNSELGVLTAELDTNIEKFRAKFWAYIFQGKRARWRKHSLLEVTSSITEEGDNTHVRLTFLMRIYDNLGRVVDVQQMVSEGMYRDIFSRMQKNILHSR